MVASYLVDMANLITMTNHADQDLAQYRDAVTVIVEDDAIQAGAPTFRGTRILVRQIADLLAQGADEAELRQDYPRLTPAMLAAAPVYARAHPALEHAATPAWRKGTAAVEVDQQPGD